MIGSLFGILAALFLIYRPIELPLNILIPLMIAVPLILLVITNMRLALAWSPLQKATKSVTPHLLNLFKKDRVLSVVTGWFFIFNIVSFIMALNIYTVNSYYQNVFTAIWMLFFGISFDCLQITFKRICNYLNPFAILDNFEKAGIRDIQNDHDIDFYDQIDAISETAVKGMENKTPFLTKYALKNIQNLSRIFLESSKSLTHRETDKEMQSLGVKDKVTYTLSYILQRIDSIFQKALSDKSETVLNSIVTETGKIAIHSANCDISLSLYPLINLGKFATKAVENKFQNVGILALCTLREIAKEIVSGQDLTYMEIQESFLCLIGQMENISKELFKLDKTTKIMILIEPFIEIKELFEGDKMMNHQDKEVIVKDLERVIGEFQILDSVMRTMPPMTAITDTK